MSRMGGDDLNVVARARGGDMEAFRTLVERHSRRLFHLAYRMTGNEADAEDVAQETGQWISSAAAARGRKYDTRQTPMHRVCST